jgi:hypothetical protein
VRVEAFYLIISKGNMTMGTTYSTSTMASIKKSIDDDIRKAGININMGDEAYLKKLLTYSDKSKHISYNWTEPQFFLLDGGAEGFLSDDYKDQDADEFKDYGTDTNKRLAPEIFDDDDMLIAFTSKGKLISSALVRRPTFIEKNISTETANKVYKSWDGGPVSIYHNQTYEIKYTALRIVNDYYLGKMPGGHVWIDFHKEEDTNGCAFLVDENNPLHNKTNKRLFKYGDASQRAKVVALLNGFEPKFIKDISKFAGKKSTIGTMNLCSLVASKSE